jgi:hypothetical protein
MITNKNLLKGDLEMKISISKYILLLNRCSKDNPKRRLKRLQKSRIKVAIYTFTFMALLDKHPFSRHILHPNISS